MGFLSRIVADARAHAPMVRATARDVDRTQAAAEGGEIVEAGPPLSPPSPSPSGVELAATLSATPPMAVAPRSATHSAPAHDDRNAAPDPAARAPGDRPGLPVVPSSSPASPAAARAAMTASGAPSTPQPLASRRAPVSAEPARSRIDEAAAHQVRAAVPDSRRAGTGTHARARRSATGRASDRRPRRPGARSADRADRHRSAARRTHRAGGPAGNPRCRAHAHATGGDPGRRAASHARRAERLTRPRATCRDFAERTRHRAAPPGAAEPDDRAGRRARSPHRTA